MKIKILSLILSTFFLNTAFAVPSNLPLTVTEADGTSLARTTIYTWHSTLRIPLTVTVPVPDINAPSGIGTRVISYTYVSGTSNPSQISIVAPSNILSGGNITLRYNRTAFNIDWPQICKRLFQ